MQLAPPLGILGGTFDPIHNGHILPVLEGANKANIKKVALMPCYIPSHKDPATASSNDRLKMVELVCAEHPLFYADARDIHRQKPTFSVDSLTEMRQAMPTTPLCFFIGTDSLQNLFTWHNWEKLFSLCHFVVCTREGDSVTNLKGRSENLQALLNKRQIIDPMALHNSLAGHIYLANTQTFTVSSTEIRKQLLNNQSVKDFLPPQIIDYIHQHKLYQPSADFC
ncbi:nicotinate-nucleotide adenylyltransferase [uncultured Paraglaciecola sp.]|uniref:nicotinate-nucleotide adenylyltransferase n=1 Tax=uncultured Paraglaciecola sp. TaxID=1765024 RepID=UPI0030D79899|tara:strand:+ start:144311 stop:144982 length:672 start_codon:yes stop_codon:yes gene_type:complete